MKNLYFIFCLFFLQGVYGQRTLEQLNQRIYDLPQNQKVIINEVDKNLIKKTESIEAKSIVLPTIFKEATILQYNDRIQYALKSDEKKYKDKFSSRFKLENVRVIPEYYIDKPVNGDDTRDPLIFAPIITNWKPLTYADDVSPTGYKTKVSFILFCESDDTGQQINNPVNLEITSSKLNSSPQKVSIDHVNLPSTDIELFTENAMDSVDIRIITNSNANKGYTHYLKVDPVLQIKTEQQKIQGLGIQEASFVVQFRGSSSSERENIIITSSAGEVNPASFPLAYNETKLVRVRSQGLDNLKLKATLSSSKYDIPDSNTLVIRQVFPYMFLGFALAGGLLGAFIQFGFKRTRKYPARMIMGGVLMGLLGALAYYVLGINLLKLEVSSTFNEFAVLTFSALCSLLLRPTMLKRMNT